MEPLVDAEKLFVQIGVESKQIKNEKNITQYKILMLATSIFAGLAMSAFALTAPIGVVLFTPLIGFPFLLHVILCNMEKNRLQAENARLAQRASA